MVRNLLENSVQYPEQGETMLTFGNTGSRLNGRDVDRIFDRFWRGDESCRDTGRHSGLGLALIRSAVTVLGGTVSARTNQGTCEIIARIRDLPQS